METFNYENWILSTEISTFNSITCETRDRIINNLINYNFSSSTIWNEKATDLLGEKWFSMIS